MNDIAQIQEHAEITSATHLTLKAGETEFAVYYGDVTKSLKSGARVFIPKKDFREAYGLTSSQANKLYPQALNHFGRLEAQRLACHVLLSDDVILSKDGITKTGKRGVVFEPKKTAPAPKEAKESKASQLEAENKALRERLDRLEALLSSK